MEVQMRGSCFEGVPGNENNCTNHYNSPHRKGPCRYKDDRRDNIVKAASS